MGAKDTYRRLVEQSQSATDQAAETLKEAREEITSRIEELKRKVGIERNRVSHTDLQAVHR